LTTALEGDEGAASCPGRSLPPGKDPVPIVQEARWAPGPVWTGAENLPSPPGFDPRTKNVGATSKYLAPEWWYEESPVLRTHSSRVICEPYSLWFGARCASTVTCFSVQKVTVIIKLKLISGHRTSWSESGSTIYVEKNTRNCIQYFLTLVLFTFFTCCILRCLVCSVVSCLVCSVVSCLVCIVVSCLVCIVLIVLCVLLSTNVYLLYYVCFAVLYFRCRTAG